MASKKRSLTVTSNTSNPDLEKQNPALQTKDADLETEFQKLLKDFQQGNWTVCIRTLEKLEKKFPDEKRINDFRNDFELQYQVSKNTSSTTRKRKKITLAEIKPKLKPLAITIGAVVLGVLLITLIVFLVHQRNQRDKLEQIETLALQVEALLNSSQPEKAAAIIDVMQKIDPENETVGALSLETENLLAINQQYLAALEKIEKEEFTQGLLLLDTINLSAPNFKDVPLLIDEVKKKIKIENALSEGEVAFNDGDWQKAIENFELILVLEPTFSDESFKEMLLNSYLHQIIQMMESSSSSISDIDLAETYYKRALAMIPQSKTYQSERENLQKVSRDLLELQFAQTAYAMVADPSQTIYDVNEALDYLKKASNLDPTNSTLQTEVNKMTLYQAGVQYYANMDWAAAIQQFNALFAMDEEYADGLAKQLLFESYIGKGIQYYNIGFFGDARLQFETAEALMWDEKGSANLYTARVELGRTLIKLEMYKDASSYFKYAVESIHYLQFSSVALDAVDGITDAINYHNIGQYEKACEEFARVLKDDPFKHQESVKGEEGQLLAAIAAQYDSSAQMIIRANLLTQQTMLTSDQELVIPTFNH